MFILKFFGSIILLLMFLGFLFVLFGLFIAQNFLKDFSKFFGTENNPPFNEDNPNENKASKRSKKQSSKEIPTISQCPHCNTYYTEKPEDGICTSCGKKL